MKAVDFIVEGPERALFIEIKDPEHPRAPKVSVPEYLSQRLVHDLTHKFRDTFLYEWARDQMGKSWPVASTPATVNPRDTVPSRADPAGDQIFEYCDSKSRVSAS